MRVWRAAAAVAGSAMVFSLAGVGVVAPGAVAARTPATGSAEPVIVQATSVAAAASAVARVGGTVAAELAIVDGVAASIPSDAGAVLEHMTGVLAVTSDAEVRVQGSVTSGPRPTTSTLPSVYREVVRADAMDAAGYDGAGVTVALLDTGVTETRDLRGRITTVEGLLGEEADCLNLSGEPTCADSYGHGTFMAGLIAGSGEGSGGNFVGAAPGAKIISIKVAGADGSSDVSTVLAGIQWAVSFRDTYDIGVLNLSLGTDSTQSWKKDPLNFAVERAWASGMVVVVSASNRGPDPGTISKPGDDPWVITVGATDDVGTVSLEDDLLPDFTGRGPAPLGVAKPDVVAPGAHVVSLNAPGSSISEQFPSSINSTYRRGSGTSMATAIVSGAVATMLDADPSMTPNRVKFALTATARPVADDSAYAVGSGMVDAWAAAFEAPEGLANQGLGRSTGRGGLDLARGNLLVELPDGEVLRGLQTATLLGLLFNPLAFITGLWTPLTWYLSLWYLGGGFLPTAWHGSLWEGHNWEGCTWQGEPQQTCSYGHNWEGSTWYGAWD